MGGKSWTTGQLNIANRMRMNGHSTKEIAERIGRSEESVKTYLIRNGIKRTQKISRPPNEQICWNCKRNRRNQTE